MPKMPTVKHPSAAPVILSDYNHEVEQALSRIFRAKIEEHLPSIEGTPVESSAGAPDK
jgi:hypothetical protein